MILSKGHHAEIVVFSDLVVGNVGGWPLGIVQIVEIRGICSK